MSGSGTGYPVSTPATGVVVYPDHTAPLLPLDTWRELMGYKPWTFWQFNDPRNPNISACNTTVWEHGWQGAGAGSANAAGRADIIEALRTAEDKIKPYAGYSFAPRFEYDEVPWPQSGNRYAERMWSADATGRWVPIKLRSGYVKALGAPARSLIDGAVSVVLSDNDGDTLKERFTLTVATTVTDPNEIAVYFVAADRLDGEGVSERWRVQPISVTITGGVATIIGRAWTIGKPVLHEGVNPTEIDPTVASNFATTLAVYRYYADNTDQGAFVWESAPGAYCEGSTDPSSVNTANARYVIRNADMGYVAGEAASYDTTTALWNPAAWGLGYEPARVRVSYQAGASLENGQMASRYKEILARLASAELARSICACEHANMEMHRWQFDRSRTGGANDESYAVGDKDLQNPLGTLWGQIWAWRQVQRLALAGASLP